MTHTAQSYTLHIYKDLPAVEQLRPAWDQLLAGIPQATIFSSWEWLSAWWKAYGGDRELLTFACFDSAGRLIGVAPLYVDIYRTAVGRNLRVLKLVGDGSTDSDYLDTPVLPGCERLFASRLLDHFRRSASWDVAQFNTMPENSIAAAAIVRELQEHSWTCLHQQTTGTVIDLPETWQSYQRSLSYNERGQLGKYSRRLQRKYTIAVRRCDAECEIDSCLEAFFELHRKRWQVEGKPGVFACDERRSFYRQLSRLLLARGWLELYFLELDGIPVAGEFDFRYRDTVYALQVGFDPAHAADRVGYALRGYLLERFIADGVRHYDFLKGTGGYKTRWSGRITYFHDIHFAKPFTAGSAYLLLGDAAARMKEWIRPRLPARVSATLRWAKANLAHDRTPNQVSPSVPDVPRAD